MPKAKTTNAIPLLVPITLQTQQASVQNVVNFFAPNAIVFTNDTQKITTATTNSLIFLPERRATLKFSRACSLKCPKHKKKDKDAEIFCEQCKELVCLVCYQTEHDGHMKSSIEKAGQREKAELKKVASGVKDAINKTDQTIRQAEKMKARVTENEKKTVNTIVKTFDSLIDELEKRKKCLKVRCQTLSQSKQDILDKEMIELQAMKERLDHVDLHVQYATDEGCSPDEVLSVKQAIQKRVEQEMAIYQQQPMNLSDDDELNVLLETKPLSTEIQQLGFFPNIPDPSKCSINHGGMLAPASKEKTITVTVRNERGQPVTGTGHFHYQLKIINDDRELYYTPPKVTINQLKEDGSAALAITPNQLGQYEVTMTTRNIPITHNPIKITAPWSHIIQINSIFKNEARLYDIAVHDDGTIYCTNRSKHRIEVLRPDGTYSQIGSSDNTGGNLSSPMGIVLVNDTMYVVSYGNDTIKMFSTKGRFMGGFGSRGNGNGQFIKPSGVCNGNNRIMVADGSNNRVQVFTLDGTFIRSISCSSNPLDVAVNPRNGNIHVTLSGSNCVGIYSENGTRIETYNFDGKLNRPRAIYFDSYGH